MQNQSIHLGGQLHQIVEFSNHFESFYFNRIEIHDDDYTGAQKNRFDEAREKNFNFKLDY